MFDKLRERENVGKETDVAFPTKDMVQTLEWFMNSLGWYEQFETGNTKKVGFYEDQDIYLIEMEALHIAPYQM